MRTDECSGAAIRVLRDGPIDVPGMARAFRGYCSAHPHSRRLGGDVLGTHEDASAGDASGHLDSLVGGGGILDGWVVVEKINLRARWRDSGQSSWVAGARATARAIRAVDTEEEMARVGDGCREARGMTHQTGVRAGGEERHQKDENRTAMDGHLRGRVSGGFGRQACSTTSARASRPGWLVIWGDEDRSLIASVGARGGPDEREDVTSEAYLGQGSNTRASERLREWARATRRGAEVTAHPTFGPVTAKK